MNCSDQDIIDLILKFERSAEVSAIKCLKKCELPAHSTLLKMNLQDETERKSIYNYALAIFILNVRKKKFILSDKAKICTYVTEIAKRKWLDIFEKSNVQSKIESTSIQEIDKYEDDNTRLYEALQRLSASDKDILVSFYFYGTSLEEYGKQKKISYEAARKRIVRARERLKNILKTVK